MKSLWALMPFQFQIAVIVGLTIFVTLGVWYVHHRIFQDGYDQCTMEVKAATTIRETTSRIEIAKIGDKYAEVREKLRAEPDYLRPASPLVASTIGRMPKPNPAAK